MPGEEGRFEFERSNVGEGGAAATYLAVAQRGVAKAVAAERGFSIVVHDITAGFRIGKTYSTLKLLNLSSCSQIEATSLHSSNRFRLRSSSIALGHASLISVR